MLSLTVDCDTLLNEEKVAIFVPVTSVEVKVLNSNAMIVLSFVLLC